MFDQKDGTNFLAGNLWYRHIYHIYDFGREEDCAARAYLWSDYQFYYWKSPKCYLGLYRTSTSHIGSQSDSVKIKVKKGMESGEPFVSVCTIGCGDLSQDSGPVH